MNGQFELINHLVEPFNMKLDIKRALPPQHADVGYEITAQMQSVQVREISIHFAQTIIKSLFNILQCYITIHVLLQLTYN